MSDPDRFRSRLPAIHASIARAISLVEDDAGGGAALIGRLYPHTGRAYLIGVTGAPGAGKSTLVDRLITEARRAGLTVGVLAVDPTSPFTGGAILGDRVRMSAHAGDAGVFVRSMATRGHLGGLAAATSDAALVLDAAGKDVVIIETVGVGQDEVDIVRTADVSIVVLVPGTGDDVQAIKAGIMEIADIFVVNKADREGADQVVQSVTANLSLQTFAAGEWRPPMLKTEATTGVGVDGCGTRSGGSASMQSHHQAAAPEGEPRVSTARSARAAPARARRDSACRQESSSGWSRRSRRAGPIPTRRPHSLMSRALDAMKAVLDHVGIAVQDLEEALAFYRDALGLEVEAPEDVATQRVRARLIPVGGPTLELLEATAPDSAIARYIEKRGPGLHHITLRVEDIRAALAQLKARGVRLVDEEPRPGRRGRAGRVHPSVGGAWRARRVEAALRPRGRCSRSSASPSATCS